MWYNMLVFLVFWVCSKQCAVFSVHLYQVFYVQTPGTSAAASKIETSHSEAFTSFSRTQDSQDSSTLNNRI